MDHAISFGLRIRGSATGRLQWWREAIAEIYEGKSPRAHPIVEALVSAIHGFQLSHSHFEHLIAAREADLEPSQPATVSGGGHIW